MTKDTGGTAFPYSGVHKGKAENIIVDSQGMTLRDYFATAAMQGWLSGYVDQPHPASTGSAFDVAVKAYVMADAMLRAREAS